MTVALALGIGLGSGFLAGLLGIGGGVIMIPGMTLLLGVSQHVAQGASLAAIVATSVAGTITHSRHGYVDTKTALLVASAAVVFTWLTGLLATQLDAYLLSKIFALLLVYVGGRLLLGR